MPPGWLTIIARHSIAARLVSAAVILYDIYARGGANRFVSWRRCDESPRSTPGRSAGLSMPAWAGYGS
jgi:hypothetical protein